MNRSITLAAAGLAAGISAMTFAAPPTAEEVKAKTEAAMTYYRAQGDQFSLDDPGFHAVLDAQLNGVDPAECDIETIGSMQMLWAYSPNAKPVWIGRIVEIGQGDDWLDASLMLAGMGENEQALAIATPHGFSEVPDDRLGEVLQALDQLETEQLIPMQIELVGLVDRMPTDDPMSLMRGWRSYPELLSKAEVDADTRRKIHGQVVDGMKKGVAVLQEEAKSATGPEAEELKMAAERMNGTIAFLDGPAGRGELVGYPAPTVDFLWNSTGTAMNSLADLKGKVVVLDFWATWCGPCVGSFPQVKELVEYYDGYDVVVLGVTSEQGSVIFRDERGKKNAENFEQECEMMADYAKAMEVTWPVAFSKQDVFNQDFGIRGIPHVAIIAPDGKVAYNNLHPANPLEGKVEKINGLLKKAGLKHPPSVEEKKSTEKG
ncbi:MAG: TlpA family protein disulfide reductase [Phycisphaera sp. TMED9]|nr:MAG: TlpA family protein disulfide reductase [Phycisphaera sp. TMED9]